MSTAISLHLIAAIIWVGGMFFAYTVLRPAAALILEPPLRLSLWVQVFRRFFIFVWLSILLLLGTGYWMVFSFYGGFTAIGTHIHIMHGLGLLMVLVYFYVFFFEYRHLRHAVIVENYPDGALRLAHIRRLIGFNLMLGLVTSIIASSGRYLS